MSYKLRPDQIRTINPEKYRFSVNGKPWQTIEEMLQVKFIKLPRPIILLMLQTIGRYL